LDDGRLTDGQGRVVDFRNTVLIMTSNLGTEYISKSGTLGFIGTSESSAERESKLKIDNALKSTFRPEFLNRIDEIIMFSKLTIEDMEKIVDIQMNEIQGRLIQNGIAIRLDEEARKWLAQIGSDPTFGARPLRRALQKFIESPISSKYLARELKEGDKVLIRKIENAEELEFVKE
jgi:ATP-dependent Clp protease ATP-binding subunit ClpC